MSYIHIEKAGLMVALANGGINRWKSEQQAREAIKSVYPLWSHNTLQRIDCWLSNLSEEELWTLTDGEEGEMNELCKRCPEKVEKLLNDIFWVI